MSQLAAFRPTLPLASALIAAAVTGTALAARLRRVVTLAFAFIAAALTGCVAPAAPPAPDGPTADALAIFDAGNVELVDLAHTLSADGLYWPSGSPFEHEYTAGIGDGGYWYASGSFRSPEHLGTHLDAPIHFGEGRRTSAEIPLQNLFGQGAVIDIAARAASDPDTTLSADDIAAWEQRHGRLAAGTVVIVRTGWASRWPDWNAYYGSETPRDVATLHFPGVSAAAAEVLVDRGIAGIGIDTASIDPGVSSDFPAHRVLAAADIYNLENLTNVEGLPETGFGLIALPMKIENGTGGPARVVAIVPR